MKKKNKLATQKKGFFQEEDPDEDPYIDPMREEIEKLLVEVGELIQQHYQPATSLAEMDFTLTTKEVYHQIQELLPSIWYGPDDIVKLLRELGYQFQKIHELNFQWMFKERN